MNKNILVCETYVYGETMIKIISVKRKIVIITRMLNPKSCERPNKIFMIFVVNDQPSEVKSPNNPSKLHNKFNYLLHT